MRRGLPFLLQVPHRRGLMAENVYIEQALRFSTGPLPIINHINGVATYFTHFATLCQVPDCTHQPLHLIEKKRIRDGFHFAHHAKGALV